MGDVRGRTTLFKVSCPSCGRAGRAIWRIRYGEVRCPGCGAVFPVRGNTERRSPLSAEERAQRDRDRCLRNYYAKHEERKEAMRLSYRENRYRRRRYAERYYAEHRDELNERKRRKRRGEQLPDRRRRDRR